jgi:hypothetical protein
LSSEWLVTPTKLCSFVVSASIFLDLLKMKVLWYQASFQMDSVDNGRINDPVISGGEEDETTSGGF